MRWLPAYAAIFVVLALPWLGAFGCCLPASALGLASDMRLIVWVLSWVSHALLTAPSRLFDAPINYPAPAQLTGCEHFASSQLAFAPVYWATGNGVLAANWTAWLSYPLAAFAMDRLVRRLGGSAPAAFVAALAFALGPLRVPANLQVLQFANVYLPLVYLALLSLRDHPGGARMAVLALVVALGIFSSYYMAVMLAVTGALAGLIELWRGGAGRLRFSVQAIVAGLMAALALGAFSVPYFRRPESLAVLQSSVSAQGYAATLLGWPITLWWSWMGGVSLVLGAMGLLALASGPGATRRMARAGLVFAAVGTVLALGSNADVGGRQIRLPFAAFENAGLLFFRAPLRFIVLSGFGVALLAAAGIDWMARELGSRARLVSVALAAMAILVTRGPQLNARRMATLQPLPNAEAVFGDLRTFVDARGGGPLLQLPAFDRVNALDSEAMMYATYHWIPMIGGYTGYPVAQRAFLVDAVARLPQADALVDLVDATHLRWLLLAPAVRWRSAAQRVAFERGLEGTGMSGARWERDGWTLLEVTRPPGREHWFRAIAAGYRPGMTALGTRAAPLDESRARAEMSASDLPATHSAGQPFRLRVRVKNAGSDPWPVSLPEHAAKPYAVQLVAVWTRLGASPVSLEPQTISLPRDVEPGESVWVTATLTAPVVPAHYELSVRARQQDGAQFSAAANTPLRLPVSVVLRPYRLASPPG